VRLGSRRRARWACNRGFDLWRRLGPPARGPAHCCSGPSVAANATLPLVRRATMIATCRRGCHSVAKGQWVRHLGPRIQGSGAQGRCASRASDKRPFHRTPVPARGLGAIISADSPARVAHRVLAHFSHSRAIRAPRRRPAPARMQGPAAEPTRALLVARCASAPRASDGPLGCKHRRGSGRLRSAGGTAPPGRQHKCGRGAPGGRRCREAGVRPSEHPVAKAGVRALIRDTLIAETRAHWTVRVVGAKHRYCVGAEPGVALDPGMPRPRWEPPLGFGFSRHR